MSVIELPRLGPPAHERHQRMIAPLRRAARRRLRDDGPPSTQPGHLGPLPRRQRLGDHPPVTPPSAGSHELPEALGALSFVCLSTLFGSEEAQRVNARLAPPPSPTSGIVRRRRLLFVVRYSRGDPPVGTQARRSRRRHPPPSMRLPSKTSAKTQTAGSSSARTAPSTRSRWSC